MSAWRFERHPRLGSGRTDGRRWWVRPGRPDALPGLLTAAGRWRPVYGPPDEIDGAVIADAETLIDISALDAVRSVAPESGVVHVEAGCTWEALETTLGRRGLTLGPVPRWLVGRPIAETLAAGPPARPSPRYGDVTDGLLALRAALPGGLTNCAVSPRRATGPDFGRIPVGADHRAGLITDVHLRVWPVEPGRAWRRVRFAGWAEARAAALAVLADGIRPAWWCLRRALRQVSLDMQFDGPRLDRQAERLDALLAGFDGQADPPEAAERFADTRLWRPGAGPTVLSAVQHVAGPDLAGAVEGIPRVEVWDLRPEGATVHVAREAAAPPPDGAWADLAERVFAALDGAGEGGR